MSENPQSQWPGSGVVTRGVKWLWDFFTGDISSMEYSPQRE